MQCYLAFNTFADNLLKRKKCKKDKQISEDSDYVNEIVHSEERASLSFKMLVKKFSPLQQY